MNQSAGMKSMEATSTNGLAKKYYRYIAKAQRAEQQLQ